MKRLYKYYLYSYYKKYIALVTIYVRMLNISIYVKPHWYLNPLTPLMLGKILLKRKLTFKNDSVSAV